MGQSGKLLKHAKYLVTHEIADYTEKQKSATEYKGLPKT
jgi:hypothetical protein